MTNPTRIEVNCETGEVLEIELTDAEVEQREAETAAYVAAEAEREAEAAQKAIAKAELLAQLGITEEQAKLLLN
jgi:hypothetical protein